MSPNMSPNSENEKEVTVEDAVKFADGLAVTTRDRKNTTLVYMTATPEERAVIANFQRKVAMQAENAGKIFQLGRDLAAQRNAGKPKRSRKKTETAPTTSTPAANK